MKLRALLVASSLLMLPGCADPALRESVFRIQVSGEPETPFTGSYTVIGLDGSRSTSEVRGTTPAEFSATGRNVLVSFRQAEGDGRLSVVVWKDGQEVRRTEAIGPSTVASTGTP